MTEQRSGAAEARWAHNPKVGGSKPPFAIFLVPTPNTHTIIPSNSYEDNFIIQASEVAQRKRVGLITQRSEDRNLPSLFLLPALVFSQRPKKFPNRELNPGLSGESRVSWPPRLMRRKVAFDRDRTGDLGIMRPTRCQLRHESICWNPEPHKVLVKNNNNRFSDWIRALDSSLNYGGSIR